MPDKNQKPENIQHNKPGIKIVSDEHPYPPAEVMQKLLQPRRLNAYFMVLIESGTITYKVDKEDITLNEEQLVFAKWQMPGQQQFLP
jgi:hypothetical protein